MQVKVTGYVCWTFHNKTHSQLMPSSCGGNNNDVILLRHMNNNTGASRADIRRLLAETPGQVGIQLCQTFTFSTDYMPIDGPQQYQTPMMFSRTKSWSQGASRTKISLDLSLEEPSRLICINDQCIVDQSILHFLYS